MVELDLKQIRKEALFDGYFLSAKNTLALALLDRLEKAERKRDELEDKLCCMLLTEALEKVGVVGV